MREPRPSRSPRHPGAPRSTAVPSTLWASGPEPIDPDQVWPAPILARTLTEFSQPGDDVWLLIDPAGDGRSLRPGLAPHSPAVTLIRAAGRRPRLIAPGAVPPASLHGESVGLMVASLLPEHPGADTVAEAMALAAEQLRAGGVLVVFTRATHTPSGVLHDVTGQLVSAAQTADLLYLGHIVAAPICGAAVVTGPADPDRNDDASTCHRQVHVDVCAFLQPRYAHDLPVAGDAAA